MRLSPQSDRDSYGLVITRREGAEILASSDRDRPLIAHTEIYPQRRIAEQLTANVLAEMGLRAYCLFIHTHSAFYRDQRENKYALMECLTPHPSAPSGYHWLPFDADPSPSGVKVQADGMTPWEVFREATACTENQIAGPFAKPGWLKELLEWAQAQVQPRELRITGLIRQLNASSTFSLIRLETSGRAIWFKATGEPNLRELPISIALDRLFPGYVPTILAVHPIWNGWLSEQAAGTQLDELSESGAWETVASTLAEIQIRSIGRDADLLKNHCRDLRLTRLMEDIDPFLAHMTDFMAAQEKRVPATLTPLELSRLGNTLKQACSQLYELGFPDTLGHLDFNPGNILVSADRSVFLDWAEGCVTNPLITFEYLREHLRRNQMNDKNAITDIANAYVRPWKSCLSPDALKQGTVLSPLVAVFAYAVGINTWRSPESLGNAVVAGYFRSLTRRMYREAVQIVERKGAMPGLISPVPISESCPVTDILDGRSVTDPYRWLEDQDSLPTRDWIERQTQYARAYLDNIPGRARVRKRIREFLAVETYDSVQKVANRYFFRKRLADQEQPCIYMREGANGQDQLLVDPSARKTGTHTAVKPLRVSLDGHLLLYEVKEGGERAGTFECLDVNNRRTLADVLPHGYLRGFVFAPDGKSFYYVHEPLDGKRPVYRAVCCHVLGTPRERGPGSILRRGR